MMVLQLTPLARARVWFGGGALPLPLAPDGLLCGQVEATADSSVAINRLTVEALVPRGARAEYGLLGLLFERRDDRAIQVRVPYFQGIGNLWTESLARGVDEVRTGLPAEYARVVLDTAVGFAAGRSPAGTITLVEGAHGIVGSSGNFFRRLTICLLELMHDNGERSSEQLTTLLRERLVG